MGTHRVAGVLGDEVGIDRFGCGRAGDGRREEVRVGVGKVACDPHTRNGSETGRVGGDVGAEARVRCGPDAESGQEIFLWDRPGRDGQRLQRDEFAGPQADTGKSVRDDIESGHLTVDHRDPAGRQLFGLVGCRVGCGVQQQRQSVGPLAEQQGLVHSGPAGG